MKYSIEGNPFPVVICNLENGEKMISEGGGMSWMTPNMKMETSSNGGAGKAIGRLFAGESLFQNIYTAEGGPGQIAFAAHLPGTIKAIQITPDKPMIAQKSAFLACEKSVNLSVHFQKKLGAGFFGGEGFIMQKLTGNGIAFVEVDGHAMEYELAAGQQMVLSTGFLALMEATCTMDIVTVKGAKNMLLGGEGFFNTIVTGPGKIVVQTMPAANLRDALNINAGN
ncbi:MAG: TIGR00266 family protein [Clostridia bacterium]|nr:TIGR00266 family protein [Clostridia bacterium]